MALVPAQGFGLVGVLESALSGFGPPSNNMKGTLGQAYFDTSVSPYNEYIYNGSGWVFALAGTGTINTITTQDSTVVIPTAGNVNLSGAGSITTVGSGSTATVELTGLTNHAVLVGAGTTTITKLAVGTNGQVLLGATTADPAFGTLTTSTGIAYTTGAHALAIDVQNGGYAVVDQTTSSATLAKQTSYVTDDSSSLVTYTLPLAANAAQGNVYQVTGGSAAGWTIAQNASQTIHVGSQSSTTGTGGSVSSNSRYASLTLQCINNTGLDFVVIASSGTFTVV